MRYSAAYTANKGTMNLERNYSEEQMTNDGGIDD